MFNALRKEQIGISRGNNVDYKKKRRFHKMPVNGKNKGEKEILENTLKKSIEIEEDLMRSYLITAERIHDDNNLKERLENFAEGNAKRTKQLIDELNDMKDE